MRNISVRKSIGKAALVFSLLGALTAHRTFAHTCPPDATATGVGVTVTALRTNGAPIGTGFVAPCEPIFIQMSILYFEFDPITLGINAAFEEGTMNVRSPGRFDADVTPVAGVPLMGGNRTPGCDGEAFLLSRRFLYVVTEADALEGNIPIFATYTNGNAHIGESNLVGVVSGTQGFTVRVRPSVSCSIAPQTQTICAGGSATFTASGTNGSTPYTFNWSGPNGFAFTGPTLTISNAQPSQSGTYTAVIRDVFGCTNTCAVTLTVNAMPTCTVAGLTNVCHPSTNTYTSNVLPSGSPVTHKWSITGAGVIVGADNQPSVTVRSTAAGTYTLTSTVAANGCTNTCSTTVRARICEAKISLIKEIVCWTPQGCDAFDGSDSAVGVRAGNRCPAFCYRITVANVSPPGVELRNLIVSDNELNLANCNFPSVLTQVGTPGASFSCIISNVSHCNNTDSTATAGAIGVDAETGDTIGNVSTNDSVTAIIVPIAIVCDKIASSPADLDPNDGPSTVTLPSEGGPFAVTYGVVVSNASTMPLVAFISDPVLANCLPQEFTTGVPLAPGQVQIWPTICTLNLQCGLEPLDGSLINTIMVSAIVDVTLTNVCPYGPDGRAITASNTCDAVVRCT